MANLVIKNDTVYLMGFYELDNTVYLIERLGGIQFTSEEPETLCPVYKYPVESDGYEKIIKNPELAKKLKDRGFGNNDDFIFLQKRYTCNDPK